MTDKQVIDVSNCIYHNNDKCTNSEIGQCNCANVASCYYKEYKRKEQECEELKEQLERADEDIKMKCTRCAMTNQLDEQLDQLKSEKEELNLKLRDYMDKYLHELAVGKIDIICKLKQTLVEIKEIAEDHCVFCQKIDPETFDMSECKLCNHSKILQKISEVKDE